MIKNLSVPRLITITFLTLMVFLYFLSENVFFDNAPFIIKYIKVSVVLSSKKQKLAKIRL